MNVLQVLPSLNSGGVEKGTLEIASALVEAGHHSTVLSAGGRLVEPLEKSGSKHVTWDIGKKSLSSFFQVRKIRHWLAKENFDVVHVRSRMPAWIIWLAWRKMPPNHRPRLVSTMHGLHSVNRYSEIMTCGERVIAVSKSVEHYIKANYPRADHRKLRLIYRGIDAHEFPYGYRADDKWKESFFKQHPSLEKSLIVTLPGRMTRLKGHLGFIDIISNLKNKGLDVKGLVIGGEDPKRKGYAEEVYQAVAEKGLASDIIFAGHRSDMKELYSISSVILSLSTKPESFGRTVLEPLSMGVPVVGYSHGGVGEILTALFPDGAAELNNVKQVQEKVTAILQGKSKPVIENKQFLLSEMKRKTLELYETLTQEKR
ncbi:glycosyltransferase [Alkalimarinus coralli]|uniref:glycosyltransferase n=1 Tax=Alkalimarinus coralli TaxID=2935863 RepID=UPI00202B2627|nr:glycosyltransferase [Alkalimarinus coralli]